MSASNVRKAVITAAGRGTRHFPATRTVQKELFPLVDRDGFTKPVLQIVVEEALFSGIEQVCIVCSPASETAVRAHFAPVSLALHGSLSSKPGIAEQAEHLERLSTRVEFAVQPTPEGFGDAVLYSQAFVGDEPFLLLLGDHVYLSHTETRCARYLIDAYEAREGPVSGVQRTPSDQLHLFGTVGGEPLGGDPPVYAAREIVEKPSPDLARERLRTPGLPDDQYLAFFGMHVLPPAIFGELKERRERNLREDGEIQLTSSLAHLARTGNYYAVEVPGLRLDMGVPEGYLYTQTSLALHSPFRSVVTEAR